MHTVEEVERATGRLTPFVIVSGYDRQPAKLVEVERPIDTHARLKPLWMMFAARPSQIRCQGLEGVFSPNEPIGNVAERARLTSRRQEPSRVTFLPD